MADLRLQANNLVKEGIINLDLLLTPFGLDETQALATAVLVALMTDSLASPDDTLPYPNTTNRGGWWGDLDADVIWGGWPIGSKLWLLKRAKIVDSSAREGATTARVQNYIAVALQPFIDNHICSSVNITVTQVGGDRIFAGIEIIRGSAKLLSLEFADVWQELGLGYTYSS